MIINHKICQGAFLDKSLDNTSFALFHRPVNTEPPANNFSVLDVATATSPPDKTVFAWFCVT